MLLLTAVMVCADVTLTAKAPASVAVGEQFRLQYTVNASNASRPQLSSIPNFKILYGPATSSSQSIQIINGKTTQSSSTSYTYPLEAEKEGSFTLPSVTLTVDGQQYTSNKPHITVVKAGSAPANPSTRSNNSTPATRRQQSSTPIPRSIKPEDLFVEVTANKREVYEQEPVLLSYNVYTNLMLEQLQGKMPDLKGFVAKEIPLPREKQLTVTQHKGRTMETTLWSQYVMFPQQSGKLSVPSIPFEGVVVVQNTNIDPIDAFFFGSNMASRVNHTIKAPGIDITVKPLPPKPAGFTGAVGRGFTVSARLATEQPRENEPLVLQVKIHGLGNIDLITPPEVEFPADFETLDPKTSVKTELTTQGMKGDLTIEYLAIPNHQGHYTIPPVKFTYFDYTDGQYHTISTPDAIEVNVAKGSPDSYAVRQRIKSDIRNIHLGEAYHTESSSFWLSGAFWMAYGLLVVAFVVVNILLNRRLKTSVLGKKDRNAKAKERLRVAASHLNAGNASEYYTAMLGALLGLVAEKTSMPVNEMSSERVAAILGERGVDEALAKAYVDLVAECEYRVYGASADAEHDMQDNYDKALELISQLNTKLKKK